MSVELEYFRLNVFQRLVFYLLCKPESYKYTVFLGELLAFVICWRLNLLKFISV